MVGVRKMESYLKNLLIINSTGARTKVRMDKG